MGGPDWARVPTHGGGGARSEARGNPRPCGCHVRAAELRSTVHSASESADERTGGDGIDGTERGGGRAGTCCHLDNLGHRKDTSRSSSSSTIHGPSRRL